MNNLDRQYQDLLQDILDIGVRKEDRTGTGTLSVFGRQIRHKMSEGFPLLTTKKMAFKSIVTELLWFLRGDTNIKYLVNNDCNIWNGDAWMNYINEFRRTCPKCPEITKEEFINKIKTDDEFAKKWGNLGKIYGFQWRNWDGEIDQIQNLINELKTNPDSRRLLVSAWAVHDLPKMTLPPCHYGFQVYTRELSLEERCDEYIKIHPRETNDGVLNYKWIGDNLCTHEDYNEWNIPTRAISLMFNMRSNDVPLGLPFNIASYALLLEIIAKMVNMVPDELIANMGDCHIYLNQIDGIKEQLKREPYPLPDLVISNQINFNEGINEFLSSCLISDFKIENYQSHPPIKMPLSN